MELISIIVPIYNAQSYLDKCIESILNQTYKNLEIILVDDGSVDDSLKKCMGYAGRDKRIKVIHTENKEELVQEKQVFKMQPVKSLLL